MIRYFGYAGDHMLVTQCLYPQLKNINPTISVGPYPKLIYVMVKAWANRAYSFWEKNMALSSSLSTRFPLPFKPSLPSPFSCTNILPKTRVHRFKIHANLGKRLLLCFLFTATKSIFWIVFVWLLFKVSRKFRIRIDNLSG